jgi:hypothetical protein
MIPRNLPLFGLAALAFTVSAALGGACGGTVTAATTGETTGPLDECPAAAPAAGSACDLPDGTQCNWNYYCGTPTTFGTCEGGKWLIAAAEAQPQYCPDSAPGEGDACCNEEGLSCVYGACDASGHTGPGLTCSGGVWSAKSVPCVPCGDAACNPDSLCVQHQAFGTTYECVPDPCGGATTCDCASFACSANEACSVQDNALVCSCLDC